MENHEFSQIVGAADAPYVNERLIPAGRLFTDYTAVAHPSLPNYLAMTAGDTLGKAGTDEVSAGELDSDNLFHQLTAAHVDWRAFEESMPEPCYPGSSAGNEPDLYVGKHDPAMAFADVAGAPSCPHHIVPLAELDPARLPPFSFVTPDECNDMHSCPVATGDAWLSRTVPPLLDAGATVIVTFDEGSTGEGGGGRIPLVEVGPGIPAGGTQTGAFDHYGLLAALEDRFDLARLGHAAGAAPIPL